MEDFLYLKKNRNTNELDIDVGFKVKFSKFWNKYIKNMSSIRQILLWYLIISLTGALLLFAPISHKSGQSISFIDALFVSSSAFSDTGLSTVGIYDTFNFFGQFVTLILLNIGGVGWFTMKIFLLKYIFRKTTTYNDISDSSSELGTKTKDDTLGLILFAIIISFSSSFIFGILFSLIFSGTGASGLSWSTYGQSLWTGIYHASTSINNSGLDIFLGDKSMYDLYSGSEKIGWSVVIQLMTMFLFILGGIGFGIFYDLYRWFSARKSGISFSFSLTTKLSVVVYVGVAIVGLFSVYMIEGLATIGDENAFLRTSDNKAYDVWRLTFNTFSTRNSGFSVLSLTETNTLQDTTLLVHTFMMFIGSGPGSTAGGIRTTTFGVLLVTIWSYVRNKKQPNTFNRSISEEISKAAIKIFIISLILISMNIFIISIIETATNTSGVNIIDNIFVVFSAYGTTGLSTHSLSNYHWLSKLLIISLMFIGQMGMSTTLSQIKSKQIKHQRIYVEEYINLG